MKNHTLNPEAPKDEWVHAKKTQRRKGYWIPWRLRVLACEKWLRGEIWKTGKQETGDSAVPESFQEWNLGPLFLIS